MRVRKKIVIDEKNNVKFINGTLKKGPVTLNVYSFATDGLIIDTGAPNLLNEFKSFFTEINVEKAVLTHHHEDHSGGASYLQKKYNIPIYTDRALLNKHNKKADYPLYRKMFWGTREPFQATALTESFQTKTASWKVINTPGHASDHIALLNESTGQLFSGDLYVHPETKVILRDERIIDIMNSIEKVLTYDFKEMYCAHAGYVADGRKALKQKLSYLEQLVEKVITLHQQGYSEGEITKQIFTKTYPITYLSLGEWHAKHIVRSIITEREQFETKSIETNIHSM